MEKPSVITIDGPAGTGKSTLGALLARNLGYLYFDTGVMYRAVTLVALEQEIDCQDAAAMESLASQTRIDVVVPTHNDGRQYTVLVNGRDVTWDIRKPEVEQHVSLSSRHPGVRAELIRQQRTIGDRGQVVMVGRDIGTIVMPGAPLKVYLETSLDERARRRFAEQPANGHTRTLEQIRTDLARRDELDNHVLDAASDALMVQTDARSPQECAAWVMAHFNARSQQPERATQE